MALFRMQDQFLHTPIQQFSHIDLVCRRARDFMDPAEFLELLPGSAEHAKNFSIQAKLVEAAREDIRGIEHLIGSRRDANRPGRAGRHRSCYVWTGLVADRREGIGIIKRLIDLDLAEILAVAIEYFDAGVLPDWLRKCFLERPLQCCAEC